MASVTGLASSKWDILWINANIVTCAPTGPTKADALAICAGKIVWIGEYKTLSIEQKEQAQKIIDAQGACITPGLIDCHTHVVYGGNRATEFAQRLQGKSYVDIAAAGGGINATVQATRLASEEKLLQESLKRIRALMQSGVSTLEIKSGYGLDLETELKMLRVIKKLSRELPVTIKATFLGAHTLPLEFRNQPDAYLNLVCEEMLPAIAEEKLADAVDVFSEKIAFDIPQTKRVFEAAQKYGLKIKCHAEQLSASGAAELAVSYGALSVDHLEYLSEHASSLIAKSKTVAVLLPGAFYYLQEKQLPPVTALLQQHVPIALASDCNPGTSPILSLLLIMNMACVLFKLTPEQALFGTTVNASKALGLQQTYGTLEVGKAADFMVWDVADYIELIYYIGNNPLINYVKSGEIINIYPLYFKMRT